MNSELQKQADAGNPAAQIQLAISLLERGRPGSPEFDQGIDWLQRAAQQEPAAQVMLGHAFIQAHALPGAYQKGVAHYRSAASLPPPHCFEALARLGDLAMVGLGTQANDGEALSAYRKIADCYQPDAICDLAYMIRHGIGCPANAEEAVSWLLKAVAQGSPRAYLDLGVCFRDGLGVAQDVALAAALFSNAAMGRYPLAEDLRHDCWAQLKVEGKEKVHQLAEMLTQNRRTLGAVLQTRIDEAAIARADPEVWQQLRGVTDDHFAELGLPGLSLDPQTRSQCGHPESTASGPGRLQPMGWRPRVFCIDDFVSDDERAHLITIGQSNMLTAEQTESATHLTERDAFNGDSAIIGLPLCDPISRNIQRRIAAAVMIPIEHHEPLSVLRYGPGHEYSPHVDYFTEQREQLNAERNDPGGQRVVTFLIHLLCPQSGGETEYVQAGLRVAGKPRRATIHYNCLPSGAADPMSLHAGLPIVSGEKWLCRTAIRANPLIAEAPDAPSEVHLRGDGLEQR